MISSLFPIGGANLRDFLSNNADYVSGICNWQQEQKWIILTVDKQ